VTSELTFHSSLLFLSLNFCECVRVNGGEELRSTQKIKIKEKSENKNKGSLPRYDFPYHVHDIVTAAGYVVVISPN
jgi:hypothetical protein